MVLSGLRTSCAKPASRVPNWASRCVRILCNRSSRSGFDIQAEQSRASLCGKLPLAMVSTESYCRRMPLRHELLADTNHDELRSEVVLSLQRGELAVLPTET